jgi:transcriptional regulator with XRE-family HTH domain
MSDSEEFVFNEGFVGRVQLFRKETNMTAEQMADLLGVPADRYRKYEYRSPLPHYLIAKFCLAVGCDLEHLLLGKARERIKPVIVARKTPPVFDDGELVEGAQRLERTPGGQKKLDQFLEASGARLRKNQKIGTGRT